MLVELQKMSELSSPPITLAVLGLLYVSITSELWIPEQKVRIQIISSNMGGLGEVGYFSGVGGSKGRKSKIKGWGGPIFVP
jgi:hypothetical protein